MIISHEIKEEVFKKTLSENPNFLLLNKLGGYFWLHEKDISRYQGFHFSKDFKLYKTIHRIALAGTKGVKEAHNKFYAVEHQHNSTTEEYFVPDRFNALVYTLSKEAEFDILFDCKEQFDNREYGRYYEVSKEGDVVIVKFTKKTDKKEDRSHNKEEYSIYAAIIADNASYKANDKWVKTNYFYDWRRKSAPFERFVHNTLRLKTKQAIIGFAFGKTEAIAEAKSVKENLESLRKNQKSNVDSFLKRAKDDVFFAHAAAAISLDGLMNSMNGKRGIIAGVPWFTQFWARDELISTKALIVQGQYETVKDILFRYIDEMTSDGAIPDRYPPVSLGAADGIGWLFKRVGDLYEKLEDETLLNNFFNDQEIMKIARKLEFAIVKLKEHHSHAGLILNKPKETWMDTIPRDGARIEIQALFMNMCRLLQKLGERIKDSTSVKLGQTLEKETLDKVREQFWNGEMLADGVKDFTVRPNVFLAHYIYPDLLSEEEWSRCFNKAIEELWFDWGGFSSLDKNHPDFKRDHTGEDNLSYHNGDSWFFLNNIAAISLWKVSKTLFKPYVKSISDASAKDILWKGFCGHHSEISSASKSDPYGCWCQAWSDASYIELMHEIYGI